MIGRKYQHQTVEYARCLCLMFTTYLEFEVQDMEGILWAMIKIEKHEMCS